MILSWSSHVKSNTEFIWKDKNNLKHHKQKDPKTMKASIQVEKCTMLNESAFSSLPKHMRR